MIIPFYTSSGTAKKTDGQGNLFGVGEFFPFWGIGEDGWYNKTNYTWKGHPEETAIANNDRSKYYGSIKLRRIASKLDDLLPDYNAILKEAENINEEYGLELKEELNQGFTANGIVPCSYDKSQLVDENIRKAKWLIGVDGPMTYKLVPFKSGHNFAYKIDTDGGRRFYVLLDINPT